ncbi:uncharacterized protein L969DRAFT_45679 [Mixia osmundae IAM 14324]|uniref:Uncharacterized protein n=1 Tax=Mixia osmundae (strain CBS 9802 / IAM 14324 / JCM 22182 / KY 12970) TaxID=764103 RepID=G7DY99_MIXOS|nr:uncharacterized protein L969DRAFT_45679 [Mixia osmundae IAM 14324]KEI41462.1 hypothetical protein L969DRAFT_45679 [Mixia osmundae IAM 14324]GAA95559.1 hypothetical protein E5Q_02214 [Mixia osmundae IAM 14324]
MGSAGSKVRSAGRTLASARSSLEGSSLSAQSEPPTTARYESPRSGSRPTAMASEQADPQDSADPQLAGYLKELGQVKVPKAPSNFTEDDSMLQLLRSRKQSEEQDSDPTARPDRFQASILAQYFDARKTTKSREEASELARSFGMDADLAESLARHYTTPSITRERSAEQEKEDYHIAGWVDPRWAEGSGPKRLPS